MTNPGVRTNPAGTLLLTSEEARAALFAAADRETDPIDVRHLTDPRVIVRWTDRWETRWEHKRGDVEMVDGSAEWAT
jgi:hypothetical protein